ncbi:hypothetical protein ABZO35_12225, partial [Burkholderia pseudomallei]|uniref:hypothetical protein n=1 Tax=Burkholderia pseudomallei TaxID=28450 RepID=UPI00344E6852
MFVHRDAAKPPPIAYRATNEPAAFVRRAGAVNRSARRRRGRRLAVIDGRVRRARRLARAL